MAFPIKIYIKFSKVFDISAVWHKTKLGSQDLATKFGNHFCMATKIGRQYKYLV